MTLPKGIKIVLIIGGLLLLTGGALLWFDSQFRTQVITTSRNVEEQVAESEPVAASSQVLSNLVNTDKGTDVKTGLPMGYSLKVPFTTQAPYGNWAMPYQEACEEASVLIVDHYWKNKPFTPAIADKELLAMVDWENKTFGYYKDTTADEVVRIIKEYMGYTNVREIVNPTVDDIKKEIVAGHPVLVPAAGRYLGNKYFSGAGPFYHMLVIIGYSSTDFITNDPGTKRGAGYHYKYSVLMDAIHDWNGADENITGGRKVVIVFQP